MSSDAVLVYRGEALAKYGFGDGHPFGIDRHDVFQTALEQQDLGAAIRYGEPQRATGEQLLMFHTPEYVEMVSERSEEGIGFLDAGDTPAYPGIFDSASDVAGTTLAAVDAVMAGETRRAFVPIGGLHHAARDAAAGFCVFNDCGIAIEHLRRNHGMRRVAYVDIDAHHGDGVYYGFDDDPELIFADIHEDGRFLYPGTGAAFETGRDAAEGTKLNLPMPPGAGDGDFDVAWSIVEEYVDRAEPEFILFQCGADSLMNDPITHLCYTEAAHAMAARQLCELADRHCGGRLVATGGGGYNRDNLARAWTSVVRAFAE